jgi:ERCC4-type nuclease
MNLIIDIRERSLINSCEKLRKLEKFKEVEIKTENLDVGDIIIKNKENKDIIIIERKSVNDLISSIKDGRYSEQSYRLNGIEHENHNIIYLVEGTLRNLGNDMQMAYSSIFSINYYKGFSVFRSENIDETAYILMNMCIKLKKEGNKNPFYPKNNNSEEIIENTNYCSVIKKKKNANITKENFGEIVLCQIPSVSSVTAVAIMKEFESFNNLLENIKKDDNCLNNITTETSKGQKRKISKTCINNIIEYLKNM